MPKQNENKNIEIDIEHMSISINVLTEFDKLVRGARRNFIYANKTTNEVDKLAYTGKASGFLNNAARLVARVYLGKDIIDE